MPSSRGARAVVDTRPERSLSFAPPNATDLPDGTTSNESTPPNANSGSRERGRGTSERPPAKRRPRIVVKPGGAPAVPTILAASGGALAAMTEYPVQLSKVQPPPLRDDTLARDRLLDWLGTRIHRRVILLLAEAGYGKTTLLADFSRRTRVRTLWYRLG